MSDCNHDCSSCSQNCESRQQDFRKPLREGASVKKVIAVVSGKGGVGKSLVTSLLASEMQRRGYRAAILDADITGPSIPKAFGVEQHAFGTDDYLLPVTTHTGVQMMSMNLILEHDTEPVVWRGPVIAGAVGQFWTDVLWQDVDFMFVDMPPGTGDVPLTVFQSLPVDGVIIVTSPQDLVSMIVAKAVNMADLMKIPVLGLVENMSYFECPDCGKRHAIFGESHVEETAATFEIPHCVRLPIDPVIAAMVDAGEVESVDGQHIAPMADVVEGLLEMKIAVSWDNGSINGVFAETKYFALYEYEPDDLDNASKKLIDVSALEGEEALCKRLREEKADAVLVGEMSRESRAVLLSTGIVPVIGYSGPSDAAADLLAAGMLPLDATGSFGGCGGGCAGCGGGCSSEGCSSGCCGC